MWTLKRSDLPPDFFFFLTKHFKLLSRVILLKTIFVLLWGLSFSYLTFRATTIMVNWFQSVAEVEIREVF